MGNKIIGNGMLAKAFMSSGSNKCLFFCSGVSNSNESKSSEFEREEKLLMKNLHDNESFCFVYFSSVLADHSKNDYYMHKAKMERLILDNSSNYLILRLPQVAGHVLNETLLPCFVKNIYTGNSFTVYKGAVRTIIDVDDVVKGFDWVFNMNFRNKILNLCPNYAFNPEELVKTIEKEIGRKAYYNVVDRNSIQLCQPNEVFKEMDFLSENENYLEKVVKKYSSGIINLIDELVMK
ncbi:NAD-dependent epimerase/dehydratase family protein [Paenalcaligenes niemegkensis]|uniref:NAD-dependent epimerase/dehydratase family protein n=1 Tax=Paenalcaligenes niemegkensis TaxID=2895469 RepID=UPI001EE8D93F|nr:NAD-dependent epimerase/dehydratase family protein [Paenalcaligenes niemegkensis]MCQ9618252.1 NAD-dependent epimerase/dehydratase family protein [Paenalcaligenes niemegkensis]